MNKSKAAENQKIIASFIKAMEFALGVENFEFGKAGDKSGKFIRHTGNEYSFKFGDETIVLNMSVKSNKDAVEKIK